MLCGVVMGKWHDISLILSLLIFGNNLDSSFARTVVEGFL